MSDKEKQDNMLAMKAMNEFAIEDEESVRCVDQGKLLP